MLVAPNVRNAGAPTGLQHAQAIQLTHCASYRGGVAVPR